MTDFTPKEQMFIFNLMDLLEGMPITLTLYVVDDSLIICRYDANNEEGCVNIAGAFNCTNMLADHIKLIRRSG